MADRFVFLGPPGAGKGTQALVASDKIGIPAIATGAIFREAIGKESAMGRQVAHFVNSGLLVPDKLANAVVAERLQEADCKTGFILDGYPRSLVQAKSFDGFLAKAKTPLDIVLYFEVSADVVIDRMGQRRVCSQCGATFNLVSQQPKRENQCDLCGSSLVMRTDDQPEAIRKRLEVYHQTTEPLLQHYDKKGILRRVNASEAVSDVTKNVFKIVGH